MSKIRVLIVDDSELIRALLTDILSSDSAIEVVAAAADPFEARDLIKQLEPDVVTLDIEMPRMDGLTFLRNLMRLKPMPVVMISTLTEKGADVTLEALEIGAVDYISKPKMQVKDSLESLSRDICAKVKQAARVNVDALDNEVIAQQDVAPQPISVSSSASSFKSNIDLIVIGSSTGGTEAIKRVLSNMPENMPPIAIVQHMPGGFTKSFASRLDTYCQLSVHEFDKSGTELLAGNVYIANGEQHFLVDSKGGKLIGRCEDSEPVNRHKPSVDVLFHSVAQSVGKRCIGVILTGMGYDGADGMSALCDAGAMTIAQDKASSVVWGMPRVAVETGAAKEVIALGQIGQTLVNLCHQK